MRFLKGALLALLVVAGVSAAMAAGPGLKGQDGPRVSGHAVPGRATLPPGTLPSRPVATRPVAPAMPDTWSNLFTDDFEGGFPGPWLVVSNGLFGDASWGRWTCWSGATPTHSVGSAAGGVDGRGFFAKMTG